MAKTSAQNDSAARRKAPDAPSVAENVKETLESFVVALIMAFIFRAFIVEAFVIPTGSMADTLYGQQYLHTCSICGYHYALGATGLTTSQNMSQQLNCPNCETRTDKLSVADLRRPNSGDRILVHKWPFYLPGDAFGPQRWKVTVFKDPNDGFTNFIKRLVGMPGEVLQIIDGDIYTASLDSIRAEAPEILEQLDALRLKVYEHRIRGESYRDPEILRGYRDAALALLPYMRIQRKLPDHPREQESLWFDVYDHDHLPHYETLNLENVAGWTPVGPEAEDAWRTSQREIEFTSKGEAPLAIRFDSDGIDDAYAYNQLPPGGREFASPVGDLRLSMIWIPQAGQGGLELAMNRDRDEFQAQITMDGQVRLFHRRTGSETSDEIASTRLSSPIESGKTYSLEFINLDYRVSLNVADQEVLATTDAQYRPDPEKLARIIDARNGRGRNIKPTEVRISAAGMTCALRHVKIQRDVYYTSLAMVDKFDIKPRAKPRYPQGTPPKNVSRADIENNPHEDWPAWGSEGMPILLRPERVVDGTRFGGEYFMLGDNSPASKDSRLWWQIGPHLEYMGAEYQMGTVPRDQLIGEAFFVYWPSGYRRSWSPRFGIVPNFGRMRWIH